MGDNNDGVIVRMITIIININNKKNYNNDTYTLIQRQRHRHINKLLIKRFKNHAQIPAFKNCIFLANM